jgi:AmiR/NasT family two-component response regulator
MSITTIEDRELVAWATLLVSVQARCSHDDARALIRRTAAATDTTLEDVADLVVNGRVRFDEP